MRKKVKARYTDSKSLQHVQRPYAVNQLAQYYRRDLFDLDSDQALRSDPPICSHIAKVRCEQQRTEWLPQSSDDLGRSNLLVRLG